MQKIYEDRVLGNMPDKACAELLYPPSEKLCRCRGAYKADVFGIA